MQIKNILVIIIARFGDTLLVTPVIRALKQKWPDANIDVMAHKRTKQILENISDINQLTAFSKGKAKWCGWFTRRHYDIALVYNDDKPLLQYAKRKSRLTVSFSDKSLLQPDWLTVKKPEQLMPAQQERAMLASAIGVEVSDWQLNYCISEEELHFANSFMRQNHLDNTPLIGFQLQSFPAKAYRDWPVERFYKLAQYIYSHYPHSHIMLLGSTDGEIAAQSLAERLGVEKCTSLAGKLTMRQNAAMMSKLDLYVGVDTGPTHLAGALGIPMVAMYHSFHPGRFLAPQQHPHLVVIEHPIHYMQATREDPMSVISVEQVWQATQKLLETQSSGITTR
ncbi:glycosyltransferase family 9 protein [Photorhabdus heterorhabditis]|uniref:Glycosyltransferase family 9 protein n=1 Tax=Photorhabdus heterorhabditis TaxID=880156 RepID=A0A5B0X6C6_9GAMM|nr:glycosyltransferase family 9 protein [Photorhabdus heterorhabditis]KAA1194806.1 glycosyltransferase family 9 protein [Photorhabdus heterorhabditis]KOY61335.1 WalO protein [Photorhabdus heterorhabditis]MBS9443947.1 glycosyltransferase family 9 protein [Photorhabdus heterorhabditis]